MPRAPREEEFERLLEEYAYLIYSKIRGFDYEKKGLDRDDLVQEVRLRIWRLCEEGKSSDGTIRNLRAYITKIVFTTVLKEIEKADSRRKTVELRAAEIPSAPPGQSPPDSGESEALRDALRSALDVLPKREATVIRLRLRGFGFDEIARLRRISGYQARHYYYRGIEKMKAALGIEWEIK
jgi:RNA polymerase sigma factor (sigma-70 family)